VEPTYSILRNFADSWHLLFMTLLFVGIVIWALRPSANKVHDEVANSIFRNDDHPDADSVQAKKEA